MQKNEVREGIVVAQGSNGEGIIKQDGTVIFVPFTLTGEKVKFKVLKVTSKYAYGKVIEVLTPAEIRVRPKCAVFGKCGGCQFQHVKYVNQLRLKEENVANCFKKIAGIDVAVKPTVKGDVQTRYRNKLQLPVQFNGKETIIGFYAENSHRVIGIDDCLINPEWTADVIRAFKKYVKLCNIKGYDEINKVGELREIVVKEIKGNLIITAVVLNADLRCKETLIEILKEEIKLNFSLYINVNSEDTNVIFGDKFFLIYGAPDYMGDMLGIKYRIGVQSFMQVNNSVCSKLYSAVRDAVAADGDTTVIDAYSGAGLMTALLAKSANKAIGIEVVKEAVEHANELAKFNKLSDKITNYLGKCEDILPDIINSERHNGNKICLVLDPPRKGCDIKVIEAIKKSNIDKIVYVSCKPSTLARDIGLLVGTLDVVDGQIKHVDTKDFRYQIDSVRTYDMFSYTKHVETLVLLCKK